MYFIEQPAASKCHTFFLEIFGLKSVFFVVVRQRRSIVGVESFVESIKRLLMNFHV